MKDSNKKVLFIVGGILLSCIILGGAYYYSRIQEIRYQEKQAADAASQKAKEDLNKAFKELDETTQRQKCNTQALDNAKSTLKDKIDILKAIPNLSSSDKTLLKSLEEAYNNGMYLGADYNTYYENCLSINGLSK